MTPNLKGAQSNNPRSKAAVDDLLGRSVDECSKSLRTTQFSDRGSVRSTSRSQGRNQG